MLSGSSASGQDGQNYTRGTVYDRLCVILTIVRNEVRFEVPLPIVDLLACFAEAVGINICKVCVPRAKPAQKKNRRQKNRQNIK